MTVRHLTLLPAAAMLAGCVSATTAVLDAPSSGSPPTPATTVSTSGTTMGSALNAARARNGLELLSPDAALMAAAQDQANHMAQTGTLTHTGSGGSNVGQRVRRQGCSYGWVAENVAAGHVSDQSAMAFWMTSSGHRANALSSRATSYGSATVGSYRALVLAGGC